MSFRFRRASVRLAVGLVAAAVPLVGAGVAQAALAGGNPLTSTTRPDLRSATITGANSATFCFDKPVVSIADPGGFYLGGYRSDVAAKSLTASASGNCANVTVSTSAHFTFATVGEGAVRTTGNFGNRADSVGLSGSTTSNGTRGLTVAPDLQGVSFAPGAQQIAFTYDEPVSSSAIVGAGGFHFVTSGNQPGCTAPVNAACDIASVTASISPTDPNTVIVQFPVGGVPLVTAMVRAYNQPGAITSATDGVPDGYDSAPAPNSAGVVTGVPTLLSAQYSRQTGAACLTALSGVFGTCVVVDYTFNEAVSVNQAALLQFNATLSDGSTVNPTFVTEPSGCTNVASGGLQSSPSPCTGAVPATNGVAYGSTTVRGIFPALSLAYDDYLVKATVGGATITGAGGGNTPGLVGNTTAAPIPLAGCSAGQTVAPSFCAVVSTTTGHPNTPGSAPIGGNTGGKAAGYSTAPDPLFVTFDTLTNTAAVTFDSRAFIAGAASATNFQLLAADGSEIAGATNAVQCSPSTPGFPTAAGCPLGVPVAGPGPQTVYLTFPSPAVQVGNAKALEIRGYVGAPSLPFGLTVVGGNVFGPVASIPASFNVQDILSPAAVAAYKHFETKKNAWSHKRYTARYLRAELARMKHHTK